MELTKFCNQVESTKDLTGVGMIADAGKIEGFVVKYNPSGMEIKIPSEAIKKCDWSMLYEIMTGQREPSVLQHMSRIVGYFSKIENWNPSKIGEMHDRHVGDYVVKEE